MPQVIDTPEELETHKSHATNPQPEICDLCWIESPYLTESEMNVVREALKEMGDDLVDNKEVV